MRYTLTIRDEDLAEARRLAFLVPNLEGACFLLCGESRTQRETRLLCKRVLPVPEDAYLERREDFMSLDSSSYVAAAKIAREEGLSLVFVHSHPVGENLFFSKQDDLEEPKLQEFFSQRVPGHTHGALVLTDTGVIGRVWIEGGFISMAMVRTIGSRFLFYFAGEQASIFPEYFDRQVRAFGADVQSVLSKLHVGIVGVGGTGSPMLEQLVRLGVGQISIFDRDAFEVSNVNRVYGSGSGDAGVKKTEIARRNVERIALGTELNVFPEHITEEEEARALRDCDVVFGCTDNQASRAILTQLSLRYLIPVIDMAVLITSEAGRLRDVVGRVTTLIPGEACLLCRGRIDPKSIMFELLPEQERERQAELGYAPELRMRNPAVIAFTTAVAAAAVNELLHRLTGFMGAGRESTEVIHRFHLSKISTNREPRNEHCLCSESSLWGDGDADEAYLGIFR